MKKIYTLIVSILVLALFSIWFFHPNQALKRKSEAILKNFTTTEKSNIVSKALLSGKLYAEIVTIELEEGVSYFQQISYLQTKQNISNTNMVQFSQSLKRFAHILKHDISDLTVNKLEKNTYAVEFSNSIRIKIKHSPVNTTVNCNIKFVFIKGSKSGKGYQLNKIIFF